MLQRDDSGLFGSDYLTIHNTAYSNIQVTVCDIFWEIQSMSIVYVVHTVLWVVSTGRASLCFRTALFQVMKLFRRWIFRSVEKTWRRWPNEQASISLLINHVWEELFFYKFPLLPFPSFLSSLLYAFLQLCSFLFQMQREGGILLKIVWKVAQMLKQLRIHFLSEESRIFLKHRNLWGKGKNIERQFLRVLSHSTIYNATQMIMQNLIVL